MVLMGVRQDDEVEMSIPERDPLVEPTDEQVGVGSAVDEHPPAVRGLEEDRIPLADVEDGDLQEDPVARHEDQGERQPRAPRWRGWLPSDGDRRGRRLAWPAPGRGPPWAPRLVVWS